jgi:recombinase-like protein
MAERGNMRTHLPASVATGVIDNFNPYLETYRNARPNKVGGAGQIFSGADRDLIVWQTRAAVPSEYEQTLADALEQIFSQKIYDLPEVVAALNGEGIRTPAGDTWTENNLEQTFQQLGKLAWS